MNPLKPMAKERVIKILKECTYNACNQIEKFSDSNDTWNALLTGNKLGLINKGWIHDRYQLTDLGTKTIFNCTN